MITHAGTDHHRVERIIGALSQRITVRALGGSAWEVEYADFEDRSAALEALNRDLDEIAGGWREVLATK